MAHAKLFAAELYTVVENMTGVEKVFGYLGPRGMRLAAGEVVAVPGDLMNKLGATVSQRRFQSLQAALQAGKLLIRSRPAPILWDQVNEYSRSLALNNGVLGLVDPQYLPGSESEAFVSG